MKKYCWLNIETGKFSNSWNEKDHKKYLDDKTIEEQTKLHPEWKLICYECINDKNFEFIHHMKLR
jgi:hypothetical protein